MWAIGVITFLLLTGRPPFNGRYKREIRRQIILDKVSFPKNNSLSTSAKDFVRKLMEKEPEARLCAKEASKHTWLQGSAETEDLGQDLVKSIENYSSISKLKKLIVGMLLRQMTEADHRELKREFDKMDTDRDGFINLKEMTDYLHKQGGNYEDAKATASSIIKQFDQDGDNQINEYEWGSARLATKLGEDSIIKEQFERFDVNGDGYISADELCKFFNLSGDCIKRVIEEVDQNNDGKISFHEFVSEMKEGCLPWEMLSPNIKNQMPELRKELEDEEMEVE